MSVEPVTPVPPKTMEDSGNSKECATQLGSPLKEYNWAYITNVFIESPAILKSQILKLTSSNDPTTESVIDDIFYEILLSISEYPTRISHMMLSQLLNEIVMQFPVDKRSTYYENFILLSQSFPINNQLNSFLRDCSIDKKFKILHFDKSILRNYGIFPEYGKYHYNDARNRIFSVETFSSLHESSEGYAKFISYLYVFWDSIVNVTKREETYLPDVKEIQLLLENLYQLISEFSLDQNRCFLLILNILSRYTNKENEESIALFLKCTKWWKAKEHNNSVQSTVVDYLLNYKGKQIQELKLITLLIKNDVLEFYSIYNSLSPLDIKILDSMNVEMIESSQMDHLIEEYENDLLSKSKTANSSALALAAPLLPDSDDEDYKQQDERKDVNAVATEETKVSLLAEKDKIFRKIQFLEYLLDYKMFDEILLTLIQYPKLPLISNEISDKLNQLIEDEILPFYLSNCANLNLTETKIVEKNKLELSSIDEVLKFVNRFLPFVKHKIARNSKLLETLVRIMDHCLTINIQDKSYWLQFFRTYIFPYLSFSTNIPVINQCYDVFSRNFSFDVRYNLYGEYLISYKKDLFLKLNFETFERNTKSLLKRLSVENVSTSSRALNRLTSINPLSTSLSFISHLESYSSLIDLICENSKFFNDFAWDVITFQLLNKLNSNKMTMQDDGINYSSWFINLSQFIGKMGKKYPDSFKLKPILESIILNLELSNIDHLSVLKEIIDSMTGIKSITNLTNKQIMRMNAEPSLQRLAYISIQDNRLTSLDACNKLFELLIADNTFEKLFVLLLRIPNDLISNYDTKPLKFINSKIDEVTNLTHSLISAFNLIINDTDFERKFADFKMISPNDLISKFKIQPQWIFQMWRSYLKKLNEKGNTEKVSEFSAIMKKSIDELVPAMGLDFNFYMTFWKLSLYDINFEDLSYMMEYSELKSQISGIWFKLRQRKTDLPDKEIKNLDLQRSELTSILTNIREDSENHEVKHKNVKAILESEKNEWFDNVEDEELNSKMILKYCLLPRMQQSPFDAVYVSKFVFYIHRLGVKGYSLYSILNNFFMFDFLPNVLFTNTTLETENLALCYQIIFEKLNEWRSDENLYNKESCKFNKETSHTEFKEILYGWNVNLLTQIINSLKSEDYTTLNNAILFIKVILKNFPKIEQHSDELMNQLELISNEDPRDDIKLSSRALIGLLTYEKPELLSVWEFYEMPIEEKEKAMKEHEVKVQKLKEKEDELKKKQLENDKVEREKLRLEKEKDAEKTKASKPYGLVGLSNRRDNEKKEIKSIPSGPSANQKDSKPANEKIPLGPTEKSSADNKATFKGVSNAEEDVKDVTEAEKEPQNISVSEEPIPAALAATKNAKKSNDVPETSEVSKSPETKKQVNSVATSKTFEGKNLESASSAVSKKHETFENAPKKSINSDRSDRKGNKTSNAPENSQQRRHSNSSRYEDSRNSNYASNYNSGYYDNHRYYNDNSGNFSKNSSTSSKQSNTYSNNDREKELQIQREMRREQQHNRNYGEIQNKGNSNRGYNSNNSIGNNNRNYYNGYEGDRYNAGSRKARAHPSSTSSSTASKPSPSAPLPPPSTPPPPSGNNQNNFKKRSSDQYHRGSAAKRGRR